MPVSGKGNEEMGVKSNVGQFSEYGVGIPIKKRRFPLIFSTSQSVEDSPSLPTENESEQKGFSSPLQGSAISIDGIVATSSNTGGVEASLNTSVAAGSLNASSAAGSSNASGAAGSSNASGVAASLNAGSLAASSNAPCVAASSASSAVDTSNASVVLSFSNVSSIAANVSSFSDASEKTVPEKEKRSSDDTNGSMVQGNINLLRVKLEEQHFTVHSRSLADIDSKQKLVVMGECDNNLRESAKSELDPVGNDSLTLNIGKNIYTQQNVDGKCTSEVPAVSGNPRSSLGLTESFSAMASGNNEHGYLNQEKEEPLSLNLSLSKGECSTQLRSNDVQLNANGANMLADRSNWDLNTTMDVWEGPTSNDGASKETTHMDDIKPLITGSSMPTKQQQILEEIEHRAKIAMSSSAPSSQQYSTVDSLCLGLTTPYLHLNSSEKPSSSTAKLDLQKVVANISSPGEPVPISKPTMVNYKPVKSEPLDQSIKTNSDAVLAKPMGLLNITQVKRELVESCRLESSKSSSLGGLVDARSIKPEPVLEANQETLKSMEGSLNQSDENMPRPLDTTSTAVSATVLSSGDVSTHAENFIQAKETEPSGAGQVVSKMISFVGHDINESKISGEIDNSTSQNKNCRMKLLDLRLPDSRGTVEGSVSDEEKINLSGDILEEDLYGSDYESDGNRELAAGMDMEHDGRAEDDFEDGEVRERLENTEIEAPRCEGHKTGKRNDDDDDTGYRKLDIGVFVGDNSPSPSSVKEKEAQREDPGKISNENTNECIDNPVNKDSNSEVDKMACLQESSAVEMPSSQTDKKRLIKAMPRKPLDVSEKMEAVKRQEGEETSIPAYENSQGTSVTISQGADDAKETDLEGKCNLVSPKAESSINGDDTGKYVNSGGNKSRIISLPRASNLSSPGRTRPILGRTLQSQVGRERLPDIALEGDKFHPRGRDETYGDGSHKFSRERHHNQPSRNNRISFMRGRGRISSRVDTLHGEWDSECSFASELYNGPTEFRVVRHKYASTVSGADLDFSNYNNGQDGAYFGTGRGGRKILSDDSSVFPHLPPRRRSPGGRDGPAARGLPMVRRVPRNLSPSRCIGEDGSELVGLRHMRGFGNDHTDPMFARSQPSFEGLDGSFVRGNREFPSVQRRGHPRIPSKSPTRPRTRSPGPWHSPRRRSPDGFGGPLELPHRRSPPIYRMDRIRSPDRPCFAGEMVLRRHGSPPYLSRPSNDLRDLDLGRDHGHPRSGIPSRSPSGRILLRNSRRLELVDPRERNDGDDYFGGPMPSGRFHELGTDGNADERRRYGDRRGPVRPFRPPYSSADSENFNLNAEGGPRSFRFCPEDDPELHERGNMRDREFDRRIKNRPGNAPRRTRNIEQEGNFRHGGQVWHDDGFDDTSRVKRKRFE